MIKALSMEFYKIRHRKIGLTVLMIIAVQFMWAFWAIKDKDGHKLSQIWMYSLYLFSTINCIMMPILVAVVASRLSDIEHKGNTFKLLKTIIPSGKLFAAKFLCGSFYMMVTVISQILIMIFIGELRGLNEEFPTGYFVYYALFTLGVNLTLLLLQLILSLQFINQMITFIVAIAGSFLGLYSLFFGSAGKFILWSYYAVLSPVGMNWDKGTRNVDYYWLSIPLIECCVLIGVFVMLYIIGKNLFIKKEN